MSGKQALVCAPRMPEIDRQGGSRRTFHFLEFLQDEGWAVTLLAEHRVAGSAPYEELLRSRGVQTSAGFEAASLHPLLARGDFDLALLTAWTIAERCLPALRLRSPRTAVVIDTVDLHFIRAARQAFLEPGAGGSPGTVGLQFGTDMVRELNTYAASDTVLTVSADEADLLRTLMGRAVLAAVAPDCETADASPVPLAERRGVVFVGNFVYPANVDAVAYLCRDILPRVSPALLAEHPVSIVGNGLDETVRQKVAAPDSVRMVGWVQDLRPHLHHARVVVVPLRYGAGTKRKLIEALMAGCPTVSTSVGAEGLALEAGVHYLGADDPESFAAAIDRLLSDPDLCQRLARSGHDRIATTHGREQARKSLVLAVGEALARPRKAPPPPGAALDLARRPAGSAYETLVDRLREVVCTTLPREARVVVISRGDDRLLALEGRSAGHFPQTDSGAYAGSYPADGAEAIQHLESLRARGAEYLVFPTTALWWLEHYVVFKQHLERRYAVVLRQDGVGLVFDLREPAR